MQVIGASKLGLISFHDQLKLFTNVSTKVPPNYRLQFRVRMLGKDFKKWVPFVTHQGIHKAKVIGAGPRRIYSTPIASSSLVLISGLSCKTTFNKELWTSIFPLYSMKPNLRNLFMKKLTRDRVVPIISASVS
jgi:hypothetical protein